MATAAMGSVAPILVEELDNEHTQSAEVCRVSSEPGDVVTDILPVVNGGSETVLFSRLELHACR